MVNILLLIYLLFQFQKTFTLAIPTSVSHNRYILFFLNKGKLFTVKTKFNDFPGKSEVDCCAERLILKSWHLNAKGSIMPLHQDIFDHVQENKTDE